MKFKTTLTIAVLFLFSIIMIGYAHADEKTATLKAPEEPEEPTIKPQSSTFQKVKEENGKERADEELLNKLTEEMNKLEKRYKDSPEQSKEAQTFMERIKTIQKRIREIQAKAPRTRIKSSRVTNSVSLQDRIRLKRKEIKESEDQIASARSDLDEIKKKTTGDLPPEVKQIERRIRYLQRAMDFDKAVLKRMVDKQKALDSSKQRPKSKRPTQKISEAYRKAILDSRIEIFKISHVDLKYLVELIKPFLTPEIGVIMPCAHPKSIILRDIEPILKQVAEIVKYVDVPKEEAAKGKND